VDAGTIIGLVLLLLLLGFGSIAPSLIGSGRQSEPWPKSPVLRRWLQASFAIAMIVSSLALAITAFS